MRVLVYAPVDLNLIDGSAVWCASVAQMLCADPQIRVDVLLHRPLKRVLTAQALFRHDRVRLRDPWQADQDLPGVKSERLGARLTTEQVLRLIDASHAVEPYDLLILRGGEICQAVARTPHLARRAWLYLTEHGADAETMAALARSNARIACQTPLLQEFLEGILGTSRDGYVPLPPMVPRVLAKRPRTKRRHRRLCYVGKFDPHYMVEETVAALAELRRTLSDVELVVAGDKFHDSEHTGRFEPRLRAALSETAGIDWRGALSREAVGELLVEGDLGCCWRSAEYDASLELSTKALEYAAAGLPVLLNPTRMNRLVFGDDYPLYVDSPETFVARAHEAFSDDAVYARAAAMAWECCQRYTFASVNQQLQPHLGPYRAAGAVPARPRGLRRVLFAGHDFKFCQEIIAHFEARPDCTVRLDQWERHTRHDERLSEQLLRWADAIWCEWCLGNAVWYSPRVRPGQRLVVRLHRQEITTTHPREVTWSNVAWTSTWVTCTEGWKKKACAWIHRDCFPRHHTPMPWGLLSPTLPSPRIIPNRCSNS